LAGAVGAKQAGDLTVAGAEADPADSVDRSGARLEGLVQVVDLDHVRAPSRRCRQTAARVAGVPGTTRRASTHRRTRRTAPPATACSRRAARCGPGPAAPGAARWAARRPPLRHSAAG